MQSLNLNEMEKSWFTNVIFVSTGNLLVCRVSTRNVSLNVGNGRMDLDCEDLYITLLNKDFHLSDFVLFDLYLYCTRSHFLTQ